MCLLRKLFLLLGGAAFLQFSYSAVADAATYKEALAYFSKPITESTSTQYSFFSSQYFTSEEFRALSSEQRVNLMSIAFENLSVEFRKAYQKGLEYENRLFILQPEKPKSTYFFLTRSFNLLPNWAPIIASAQERDLFNKYWVTYAAQMDKYALKTLTEAGGMQTIAQIPLATVRNIHSQARPLEWHRRSFSLEELNQAELLGNAQATLIKAWYAYQSGDVALAIVLTDKAASSGSLTGLHSHALLLSYYNLTDAGQKKALSLFYGIENLPIAALTTTQKFLKFRLESAQSPQTRPFLKREGVTSLKKFISIHQQLGADWIETYALKSYKDAPEKSELTGEAYIALLKEKIQSTQDVFFTYQLAHSYDQGIGTARDVSQALNWYGRVSKFSFSDPYALLYQQAQLRIAEIYADGDGVAQNLPKAISIYQMINTEAARKGLRKIAHKKTSGSENNSPFVAPETEQSFKPKSNGDAK